MEPVQPLFEPQWFPEHQRVQPHLWAPYLVLADSPSVRSLWVLRVGGTGVAVEEDSTLTGSSRSHPLRPFTHPSWIQDPSGSDRV